MIASIFTTIPFILAGLLIASALWEYFSWRSRFADWKNGLGTSLGSSKKANDVGPRLSFEFMVDGTKYEGLSSYMKDDLPAKGESVTVYYDPANPANCEWYDVGMHSFFIFVTALLGIFILWMSI